MNQITSSSFSMTPLNEDAYRLNIQFLNRNMNLLSYKSFTFFQKYNAEEGVLTDVLTKNGICNDSLDDLFDKRDVRDAQKVSKKLGERSFLGPLMAVFDLKDSHAHYLPCKECEGSIAECERDICDFFRTPSRKDCANASEKIRTIFQSSLPIDFILLEGSLKRDLLLQGGFSEPEAAYFNSSLGVMEFCQCAEFFMNGFKLGQTIQDGKREFLAERYIVPISQRFKTFQPCTKSTVYYPSLYKEMYGVEGNFAKILNTCFSVTGEFSEETRITTLHVVKKRS